MSPDDLPELSPVSLDISRLQYECSIWPLPGRNKGAPVRYGGLIAFRGVYAFGSAGDDDARFIHWRLNEFSDISAPRLAGLIVDFRDLDYTWGDDLAVEPDGMRLLSRPVRVVVLPNQYEAFCGVLGDRELRTDLRAAFSEVAGAVDGASGPCHEQSR